MRKITFILIFLSFNFLYGQENNKNLKALPDTDPPTPDLLIKSQVDWLDYSLDIGGFISTDKRILCWDRNNNMIGIGTIFPKEKLHIDGNIRLSDNGSYIKKVKGIYFTWNSNYGTNFNHGLFSSDGTSYSDDITLNSYGNVRINFDSNNNGLNNFSIGAHTINRSNTFFKVFDSGEVSIGSETKANGYKLSVDGKIICEELNVKLSESWADFVFDETYDLTSLAELKSFIKTNKHLPEIPTAEVVEENGISVGEMNAKLLQKIEELTLYTIQQQEVIEALLLRVEQLENK